MKRKKVNSKIEEKIITAMITSDEFLSQFSINFDLSLFSAEHFKLIAKWCVSFFQKYHKAPKENIETRYHSWVEKGKPKEESVEAIADILERLSDNYEEEGNTNIPYLLDEASEFFSLRKFEQLRDNLEFSLLEKDIDTAENAVNSFRNTVLGTDTYVDTFQDTKAVKKAFSDLADPLFSVGGEHSKRFFQHAFARDNLIAILAPEKRGKTFWCVELTIRALMARKKVALFEVGDMSQSQIIKRVAVRLTGMPMFGYQCGKIGVPVKIKRQDDETKIKRKTRSCKKPVNEKETLKAMKKFMRRHGIPDNKPYFITSVHPNSSVNVAGIFGILEKWEYENDFVPDVIIIDYADILADEPNTQGYGTRDKINETWKALRRLSQEKHALVIVPTQADAKSYDQEIMTAKNFSEDKRKLAHVTGMLGLNQTMEEKDAGIMRLNWIVLREAPFTTNKCLYVGQCLELSKAFCCSWY